jgi:hypothetical protein
MTYLEAPHPRPELTVVERAHHDGMNSECNIIKPYRRFGRRRVPVGILVADQRRVQEC